MTEAEFVNGALANSVNGQLLVRLRSLNLPGCHLTAGCLFQAIWNKMSGRPAGWGVKDYDVFYFDNDMSWDAEDRAIREIAEKTSDLSVVVEARNQARVHLWYPERFGGEYPQLRSSRDGIDRYLICCTCVGIEVTSGEVYAPYGLKELAHGILRMNPLNPKSELFDRKVQSYRARWPWLTTVR